MGEDVIADDTGGEGSPGVLDDAESVVADADAAESFEPTDGAFDDPADLAETTPVRGPTLGDFRFDAQPAEQTSGGVAIVAAVGDEGVWVLLRSAGRPADGGVLESERDHLGVVAGVGAGGADRQGDAVAVDHQRVFRAGFPAVHGTRTGVVPAAEGPHGDTVHHDQIDVELARLFE